MALADIIVNDGASTPVAHTFTYITTQSGRVVRNDNSAAVNLPLTMTISHGERMLKGKKVKTHMVRFDQITIDADGVEWPNSSRIVFEISDPTFTDALIDNLAAFQRNYNSSANARLLARGSVG